MVESALQHPLRMMAGAIAPRRSLSPAALWLIIAQASVPSVAAAIWVGNIAGANVLAQHVRRLALETDQLSSEMSPTVCVQLGTARTAGASLRTAEVTSGGRAAWSRAV